MNKKLLSIVSLLFLTQLVFSQNTFQKAKTGNVEAMFILAKEYYTGIGQIQSYSNALTWFERAANKNHIESMYRTAQMYEKGQSVNPNDRIALDYYRKAAEKGHFASQLILAQGLGEGRGGIKSPARALLWYRVCAQRDEPLACRKLGDYYTEGRILEKDHSSAKYWYEKAIEKGDREAKAKLAYLYVIEGGIAPNYEKANELNHELLLEHFPLSLFNQGMISMNYKNDNEKAFDYFQKSMNLGFEESRYRVGIMKYYGKGTSQDVENAIKLFETLPEKYKKETDFLIANAFRKGLDIDINNTKAIEFYKSSANYDNSQACIELAQMYENGIGVRRNLNEARKWRQRANDLLNPNIKPKKK